MKFDLARPVPGPRIVPFGEDRLPSDVLANGRPAFRVTQRFGDINPAFPGAPHGAVDLGNFNCGDQVYAVYGGLAKTIGPDQYGALGITIDHGGWSSLYWHLNGFTIPRGDRVPVTKGQQIGIVGKTGLGAVCHLHHELSVNGTKIDPEPYLFGAPLVIEDDVKLPDKRIAYAKGTVVANTTDRRINLREGPSTDAPRSELLTQTAVFDIVLPFVEGGAYTLNGVTRTDWALIARAQAHYIARPLLSNITPTPEGASLAPPAPAPADCSAQDAKLQRAGQAFDAICDAAVAGKVVVG